MKAFRLNGLCLGQERNCSVSLVVVLYELFLKELLFLPFSPGNIRITSWTYALLRCDVSSDRLPHHSENVRPCQQTDDGGKQSDVAILERWSDIIQPSCNSHLRRNEILFVLQNSICALTSIHLHWIEWHSIINYLTALLPYYLTLQLDIHYLLLPTLHHHSSSTVNFSSCWQEVWCGKYRNEDPSLLREEGPAVEFPQTKSHRHWLYGPPKFIADLWNAEHLQVDGERQLYHLHHRRRRHFLLRVRSSTTRTTLTITQMTLLKILLKSHRIQSLRNWKS